MVVLAASNFFRGRAYHEAAHYYETRDVYQFWETAHLPLP